MVLGLLNRPTNLFCGSTSMAFSVGCISLNKRKPINKTLKYIYVQTNLLLAFIFHTFICYWSHAIASGFNLDKDIKQLMLNEPNNPRTIHSSSSGLIFQSSFVGNHTVLSSGNLIYYFPWFDDLKRCLIWSRNGHICKVI